MDKVDFLTRSYKRILPEPVGYVENGPLRDLQIWLVDDVCPVIEEFARRPKFREHAAWVLDAIYRGAGTAERREIDALDAALIRCAGALARLAAKRRIRSQLAALYRSIDLVASQKIKISAGGTRILSQQREPFDETSAQLSQVAAIAKRPWTDLVNLEDYFEPKQEFVRTNDGQFLQRGEFIVSLNPELHPIGNFVVRCMFRRVDGMFEVLSASRVKILRAVRAIRHKYSDQDQLEKAWHALQASHAAVRKTFQMGSENQMRDSCVILTQVYASFHPSPDLSWLAISPAIIESDIVSLRHRITHFRNGEMFDRIAAALGDLKRLYADDSPNQSALDEAIASGGLAIQRQSHSVYWERKQVNKDWARFRMPWRLLVALSEKAKLRGSVTESDLYADKTIAASTLGTNAERLRKLLPASLRKLIVPGATRRSYRLDLEPSVVRLFD